MQAARAEYREKVDTAGTFMTEELEAGVGLRVGKTEVFERYRKWCFRMGLQPMSMQALNAKIRDRFRGFIEESMVHGGKAAWIGLALREE